jgi:hypothetical protein
MRSMIDEIQTPLMLYVEQDTPLVTTRTIDWAEIGRFIQAGTSNVVRLHHEAVIPQEHHHLLHGREGTSLLPYIRTSQWSQRPHLASVAYYRRILASHFSPQARGFIEDRMYGILEQAYVLDGLNGWLQHRVHIYAPDEANTKYSYTTDGRQGDPKWDESQVF